MTPFENEVRNEIYRHFATHERAPSKAALAHATASDPGEVEDALRSLADQHVIVLLPGSEVIWMANPFSNVPTDFVVRSDAKTWWGNCIWDAFGILAALGKSGTITTHCPDCAEEIALDTAGLGPTDEFVVHYSVPAARWWDNIGHT